MKIPIGGRNVDFDHGTPAHVGSRKSGWSSGLACETKRSTSATSSQNNYTPYYGTRVSSPGPTSGPPRSGRSSRTCFVEERKKGVLDVSQVPSSITAHEAGYIDKQNELIVGLQTDAPLKRAIMPNGGLKMVTNGLEAFGFKPDPKVIEIFTKYRKTHNEGVFDAYTQDVSPVAGAHTS
jgi:formate C-acetyltransferase